MVEKIAVPAGLFQAGQSGAGGQFEPLEPKTQRMFIYGMGTRIIYGLDFVKEGFEPSKDSVIIDCVYDGYIEKDPHASNPMSFVTDYPSQTDRGLWYGYFEAPKYTKYQRPGIHRIQIKVAPRKTAQWMRGRDFSEEAGGVISPVYYFRILPNLNQDRE